MKCVDEKRMHLFLDGELEKKENERIKRHLSECKKCLMKFRAMKGLIDRVDKFWESFEKSSCPNPQVLERYGAGQSSSDEKMEIEKHLKFCAICNLKLREAEEMRLAIERIESEELAEGKPVTLSRRMRRVVEVISRRFIEKHFPDETPHFAFIFHILMDSLLGEDLFSKKPDKAILGAAGLARSHPKFSDLATQAVVATVLMTLLSLAESPKIPRRKNLREIVKDKLKKCHAGKGAAKIISNDLPDLIEKFLAS
jgi:hypothetical protein